MTGEEVADRLRPALGVTGYGSVNGVGVAATTIDGRNRRIPPHAGLLYRWKKNDIRLFEMRSHKDVKDEAAREGFVWVEPKLLPERVRLIIQRARLVHQCHSKNAIPYGFTYRRSTFDESGGLRLGDGEIGLTCSTIVAAVFQSEGAPLINPEAWPAADEADKRDRAAFLAQLSASAPDHAALLQKDIGAPRISPEELVASAAAYPTVGTFENLQDGAVAVRARLRTL